ncbi:MAG: TRAP transporter fused permease subunit [Deltaproteobacteria bacterium]|nr:TRAP transporter fused permease subunit [Deltaproteobacteria bacterium]
MASFPDIAVGKKLIAARQIVSVLIVSWCVLVPIVHLPSYFGKFISGPTILSIALIGVLLLNFLIPEKKNNILKWYNLLPLILSLPALIVTGFYYEKILEYEGFGTLDTGGVVIAYSLAFALLVTVWRKISPILAILLTAMILTVHFQPYLPGLLYGKGFGWSRLAFSFYVGTEGVFGIPFAIACTILIMFIVFGALFQASGGGKWFLDLAASLMGRVRGGIAKSAVLASFFFGMISGSPAANTATTGSITIPMMKDTGYSADLAGAAEATASTGGQIMPPIMGSIAFIMAEWLGIAYYQVVLAAAIPATLYFVMVFAAIHFEALKSNREPVSVGTGTSTLGILRQGWYYIIPLATLVGLLLVFRLDPALAGLAAILVLIACSFIIKDKANWLYPRKILETIVNGLDRWLTVAIITAAVGMMVGSLALSGLGIKFSSFLIAITGGKLIPLLLTVGIGCFVLGMGLDSIPMYITMVILTAPALIKIGVPEIAAHLFVIYWGMTSFITPPLCIAVYVACAISGGTIWKTGGNAVRFGAGFYIIPFAFVLSPALLLIGTVGEIVIAVITALAGGIFIASGLWGYGLIKLPWAFRILHIIGGAMVILRDWRFETFGFALLGLSTLFQFIQLRKDRNNIELAA